MNKALTITAVSGILMGTLAACGGDKAAVEPPKAPTTDAVPGAKASCSGAATPATPGTPATPADPTKASCSGKGSCSGKK